MAYTAAQQAKINAAQQRLDAAKTSHLANVARYNDFSASLQPCYKDTLADAANASTWFMPTYGPCMSKGSCSLSNCKNTVDTLRNDVIPKLRSAYTELNAAQANFNRVLAEVTAEVQNDPGYKKEHDAAVAKANAEGMASKYKWVLAIVVVVVAFLIVAYVKGWRILPWSKQ